MAIDCGRRTGATARRPHGGATAHLVAEALRRCADVPPRVRHRRRDDSDLGARRPGPLRASAQPHGLPRNGARGGLLRRKAPPGRDHENRQWPRTLDAHRARLPLQSRPGAVKHHENVQPPRLHRTRIYRPSSLPGQGSGVGSRESWGGRPLRSRGRWGGAATRRGGGLPHGAQGAGDGRGQGGRGGGPGRG